MLTEPKPIDYESEILSWLLASLDSWGDSLLKKQPSATRYDSPYRRLGIEYRPRAWAKIDHPDGEASRQGYSHAAQTLADRGLVELVRQHGQRLSHLRPSPLGLTVALTLTPEANRTAIRAALKTSTWGTCEHLAAIVICKSRKQTAKGNK